MVGTLIGAIGLASHALGISQHGTPPGTVATMQTYGMGVPTRTALRAVVPQGWETLIHQEVTLPSTLSWNLEDPWPKVLGDMANQNGLSVLIDWDARHVRIRSPQQAIEEQALRAEIAQAATTPLPSLVPKKAPAAPLTAVEPSLTPAEALRAQTLDNQKTAMASEVGALPVVRTNPTPQMVSAQQAAALAKPPVLSSTPEFVYTHPVAVNRPSAKKIAQSIAFKYQVRLVWAAPDYQLRGPVTLLANSPEQDVQLLQRAMGLYAPVVVEYFPTEKVIRALSKSVIQQGAQAVAAAAEAQYLSQATEASAPVSTAAPSSDPQQAGGVQAVLNEIAPVFNALKSPQAQPDTGTQLTLTVGVGEPLEHALTRFARQQGFTLDWQVSGGFEANRQLQYQGSTIASVLSEVLPPLGISADIYTRDKHIVVRLGEARDR